MLLLLAIGGIPGRGAAADVEPTGAAATALGVADWDADGCVAGGTATFSTAR
jgi:hypothetical protein